MESRNDKLLESFMSQPYSLAVFFFSLHLDHVHGDAENAMDLYVWTLLAAVLLSKPHPYFSQNVSFSSSVQGSGDIS